MLAYNEKQGVEFVATFFDAHQQPTLPSVVEWRLDCDATGTVLQDYTSVAVTSVVGTDGATLYQSSITVPGPLNAIQKQSNTQEVKKLLVVANRDQDGEVSKEYSYIVRNLRGRS